MKLFFSLELNVSRLALSGDRIIAFYQQLISLCDRQIIAHAMKIGKALQLFHVDALEDDCVAAHSYVECDNLPMVVAHPVLDHRKRAAFVQPAQQSPAKDD